MSQESQLHPRWYTPKEAAERLRVSHDTITRLIARGELPAIRLSERILRIPAPALHRLESGTPTTRRRVVRRRAGKGVEFGASESASARETVVR
jgi:excisionase family DNA binding protein